jgi:hypothetical protein
VGLSDPAQRRASSGWYLRLRRLQKGIWQRVRRQWRASDVEIVREIRSDDRRSFCRRCGSSLFEAYPEFIEIRIGSLDEARTSIGAPEREDSTKRREHWLSRSNHGTNQWRCEDANEAPS